MVEAARRDWLREVSVEGNLGPDKPTGSGVSEAMINTYCNVSHGTSSWAVPPSMLTVTVTSGKARHEVLEVLLSLYAQQHIKQAKKIKEGG